MKPLHLGSRLGFVVGFFFLSYLVGRPLYWEVLERWNASCVDSDSIHGLKSSDATPGEKLNSASDGVEVISNDTEASQKGPNVILKGYESNRLENDEGSKEFSHELKRENFRLHEELRKPIWEVPLPGSTMPPLEAFALKREMVEFRARENVIIVTFANFAFLGFVLTWVKHLTDSNVHNILVGAMDTRILEALYVAGVPVFDMGSNMNTIDAGWGSPTFHKMGREKVILVDAFLTLGYELLMCDTDTVWVKNPLPYFERYPAADLLTSSDEVINSVDDDSLEIWEASYAAYNIGILYWRPTMSAKAFVKEWKDILLADDSIWDQNGFNDLMRRKVGPPVANSSGLFYAYDGSLQVGILPVSIFCSGHTFFVQALYKQLNLEVYAVHTTFQYAGTEGKRHRLREAKLFYDPPEYYDSPGGYMSFKPSLPDALLREGYHTVETHFSLVNHQLKQVRDALAIASILNRTLVMPELWCRLDRMWYPHPGILVGTRTKQPFLCPMDHIFEVNQMLSNMPEWENGPPITFREYSFLDNLRLPSKILQLKLKVEVCQEGSSSCVGEVGKVEVPGTLHLPIRSTEDQLKKTLSVYEEAHLIEFSSMIDVFGGFSDEIREDKFMRRVKQYTGLWCCVQDRTPGHIYYDIYWDKKPSWKPKTPENPEDDHRPF